jgi:predicted transcriptional regulator
MHHTRSIYKIIIITTYKNRSCTSVTKFNGVVTTICTVDAIQLQPECQATVAHGLVQLRSDQHVVIFII